MNARIAAFVATLFLSSSLFGQVPNRATYPGETDPGAPTRQQPGEPQTTPTQVYGEEQTGLSDWITYRHRSCGSVGSDPAVQTEVYLRVGPSFPLSGDLYSEVLDTGWIIQGGGKALFFNDPLTSAWYVDLSLANINNRAGEGSRGLPILLDADIVTVAGYNRTLVGAGLGKVWYLNGTGMDVGNLWRVSFDFGGRYGSARGDFREIRHRTDVVGGVYAGGGMDLEVPLPCSFPCIGVFGIRGEWNYTWSDMLVQSSDLSDFLLLGHIGVRY